MSILEQYKFLEKIRILGPNLSKVLQFDNHFGL